MDLGAGHRHGRDLHRPVALLSQAGGVSAGSSPGAAMLITSAAGVSLPESIGAFLMSGLLIALAGFSGWFERSLQRIPISIASAMLAGGLFRFGLDVFVSMQTQFAMVFAMFIVYLICRRALPRYAIVATLAVGIVIAAMRGLLHLHQVNLQFAQPIFIAPAFSVSALIGVAALRASGDSEVPISPVIGWIGATTVLLALFGAFALNLAAITAAICTAARPTRIRTNATLLRLRRACSTF